MTEPLSALLLQLSRNNANLDDAIKISPVNAISGDLHACVVVWFEQTYSNFVVKRLNA